MLGQDGAGLLPVYIGRPETGLLNAAAILAGPTLAAFIMTRVTEGGAGVRRLLARLILWRVGVRWYLFVLVGVPVVMLLGTMLYALALPSTGSLGGPSYALTYVGTFVLVLVLGGPLFEEPGWRGFALPRMQRSLGPMLASLVLGLLWAFWHLPEFLVPSWAATSGGGGVKGFVLFTLTAVTLTFTITWVFNNTRASLLVVILLHATIDTFSGTLGAVFPASIVASTLPFMIGFGVLSVVLIVATRGRLGYGRSTHSEPAPETSG